MAQFPFFVQCVLLREDAIRLVQVAVEDASGSVAQRAPRAYFQSGAAQDQEVQCAATEVDLALALESYGADVDFETVWGQAHVEAEWTGNSTEQFTALL